jgi:hypothetical protein
VYHFIYSASRGFIFAHQTGSDSSGVEFAALVNFIACVVLYTLAGIKVKRRLKKQRKAEKADQKR